MKKTIAWLLIAALALCLAGCGAKAETETAAETSAPSPAEEQETASAEETDTEETEDTEENRMNYFSFGSGEKTFVILPGLSVHSLMGLAESVETAYQDFCEEYTVYLFDRAYDMPEGYTIRDMSNDTADLMNELGLENADVFGASQGGMIAQYLAIDHPELVHKLILGSTLCQPNDNFTAVTEEWIALAENKEETALLESFVDRVYSEATLTAYRDVLISSNAGITDEEFARFCIQGNACKNFDCSEELSSVTCPVLVIGCEGDRVTTAEGSEQIADILGCELYLYDESYGHGVYDEAPDYRQLCLDFLAEE